MRLSMLIVLLIVLLLCGSVHAQTCVNGQCYYPQNTAFRRMNNQVIVSNPTVTYPSGQVYYSSYRPLYYTVETPQVSTNVGMNVYQVRSLTIFNARYSDADDITVMTEDGYYISLMKNSKIVIDNKDATRMDLLTWIQQNKNPQLVVTYRPNTYGVVDIAKFSSGPKIP